MSRWLDASIASKSTIDNAGVELADWAMEQYRMLEIARRPFGLFGGDVRGELVYHDPPPAPVDTVSA